MNRLDTLDKLDPDRIPALMHDAIDKMTENLRRPEYRAQLAAGTLTAAWLGSRGARPLPAILLALLAGKVAGDLVGTVNEIAEHIAHLEIKSMATDAPGKV